MQIGNLFVLLSFTLACNNLCCPSCILICCAKCDSLPDQVDGFVYTLECLLLLSTLNAHAHSLQSLHVDIATFYIATDQNVSMNFLPSLSLTNKSQLLSKFYIVHTMPTGNREIEVFPLRYPSTIPIALLPS